MNADTEGPTGPRPPSLRHHLVPTREFCLLSGRCSPHATLVGETHETSLLDYLKQHSSYPESLLHRWIRTGQIRLNGSRVKPLSRVRTGDALYLPKWLDGWQTGRQNV